MADKKYSVDDILKIFNKLNKRIDELQCFVRECCAKIPVNVGTGFGLFKKLNQNKWEFKSLLPGTGISISETNNEVIITSTVPAVDCQDIDNCLGISPGGDPNKYLNQQGNFQTIVVPPSFIQSVSDTANIDLTVTGTDLSADLTNTTVTPNTYGDATNIPQITVDQKGRVTSVVDIPITIPPNFIDSISDTATVNLTVTGTTLSADFASMNISQFTNNSGYLNQAAANLLYYPLTNPSNFISLTSLSAGTGISYNNLTGVITNSAPDQTVVLSNGTAISITGTYPNFTIANTAPDQIVTIGTTGSGLAVIGTYPNFTLQNTLPDQTVVLTQGGTTTITGTYPNFTISSADQYTGTVTSVQLASGTGISLSGTNPITTSGTITVTNTAPDQVVALTQGGTTTITGTYPNFTISSADQFVGTVTSVAALTLGTSGTDLSSTVANGTTTPVITLNVPTASAVNRGALSSSDWSTFNSKVGTSRTISTSSPLSGGGDLSADRTISIADAVADGTTKGAATFSANDFDSLAGVISLDYTNGQKATALLPGFLSAADWSTFNGKQDNIIKLIKAGANQTTTATTAQNITELVTANLEANKIYFVSGLIRIGCNNTGGVLFGITVPTGATAVLATASVGTGGTNFQYSDANQTGLSAVAIVRVNSSFQVYFYGRVSMGANTGNVQITFASAVAGQTSTIFGSSGSMLTFIKIN